MFKMLFVGCGGSGGAIVGYLMDQLRADFQRAGVSKIPGVWQFVHVDMPPAAERVAPGLGTIEQLGGHYVPLAPDVGKYELIDNGLCQGQGVRSEIATWAARRPERVMIPVQLGAGQQRAIGRVAVLSRAAQLRERLAAIVAQVNDATAVEAAMQASAQVPTLGHLQNAVYTFVVSSMAGGTGASISLDVTRVLADLTGNPAMTALFMCTADVFDTLNPENRQGVRANALAMLGELVACQTGAAGGHDVELFRHMGIMSAHQGSTFRRIIPLSSFRGQGSPVGDRKPHTIYRVTGQALAALALSDRALTAIRQRVIENSTPNVFSDKDNFGWGQDDIDVEWGSMGYASLSTGRERLESFIAQWLARQSLDHLLKGHTGHGDARDDKAQADALAQALFPQVCRSVGLPESSDTETVRAWVGGAFAASDCQSAAREVIAATMGPAMPMPTPGVQASQYLGGLESFLRSAESVMLRSVADAGYRYGYAWSQAFVARLHAAFVDAVGRAGMVYAVALADLLRSHLTLVSQKLLEFQNGVRAASANFTQHKQGLMSTIQGAIQNPAAVIDPVKTLYLRRTDMQIRGRWCEVVGGVLSQVDTQVLSGLSTSLRVAQDEVLRAMRAPGEHGGLATVHTDRYAEWPVAGELVDGRWGASVNEVLLTDYRGFEAETTRLLPLATTLGTDTAPPTVIEAARRAVRAVVTGQWPTAQGLAAPEGLLRIDRQPTFAALPTDPATADSIVPALGQYRWSASTHEILGRAMEWVRRPGFAVNDYVTASIRDLAQEHGEPSVVESLFTTLRLADPMTPVDSATYGSSHQVAASIQYAFSAIPLEGIAAGEELLALAPQRGLGQETVTNLTAALSQQGPSRIDVYGYYPLAMPVAHAGVCNPAAEQWAASTTSHDRAAFWDLRRARPLYAAIAMSPAERQALVAGWFVGTLTGAVAVPEAYQTKAVSVYDPISHEWLPFPFPYLTAPEEFRMHQDLLPAVLESHLVAVSNYARSTPPGRSLAPYRALRRLWDSSSSGPIDSSFGVFSLKAEALLTKWRRDGQPPRGRPRGSKALPVEGADATARTEAAKAWAQGVLTGMENLFGTENVAYRTISGAAERYAAPMLRDLYPDIEIMLPRILELLDRPIEDDVIPGGNALPDF